MRNSYTKHLLKHSLVYGSGELLTKVIGFILIPIYTRYLTTETYGILQILLITTSLISVIVQMGLGSAIFRSILHNEGINKETTYSTAFYFLMCTSLVVLFPIYLISDKIALLITGGSEYDFVIKILLISILLKNIAIIPLAKLRIQNKSFLFTLINSLRFVVQIILNLYFIIILKKGIEGIIIADCITALIFSPIFIYLIFADLRITFSLDELTEMIEYGLPLVPAALAMFILNSSDRYFLKYYSTLAEVGLYSLGYRIGIIMALIVVAFQQVWGAAMFKIAKEKEAKEIYSKNFTYFLVFLFTISLGISIFAKNILQIMATAPFISSYKIIPIITFSYIFYGIYFYTAVGLNLKKKTIFQPFVVGFTAIVNIILNFFLIPPYGIIGAAISTLISFAIMAIIATQISQHFYYIKYEYNRIIAIFLTGMILFLLSGYIKFNDVLLSFLFKLILWISYPILLIFSLLEKSDQNEIKAVFQNYFKKYLKVK